MSGPTVSSEIRSQLNLPGNPTALDVVKSLARAPLDNLTAALGIAQLGALVIEVFARKSQTRFTRWGLYALPFQAFALGASISQREIDRENARAEFFSKALLVILTGAVDDAIMIHVRKYPNRRMAYPDPYQPQRIHLSPHGEARWTAAFKRWRTMLRTELGEIERNLAQAANMGLAHMKVSEPLIFLIARMPNVSLDDMTSSSDNAAWSAYVMARFLGIRYEFSQILRAEEALL